jgi:hypothetical protein
VSFMFAEKIWIVAKSLLDLNGKEKKIIHLQFPTDAGSSKFICDPSHLLAIKYCRCSATVSIGLPLGLEKGYWHEYGQT